MRTFTDGYRKTTFEMVTDNKPTQSEIVEQQCNDGYDPRGYGFFSWSVLTVKMADGKFKTTWECSGSCD